MTSNIYKGRSCFGNFVLATQYVVQGNKGNLLSRSSYFLLLRRRCTAQATLTLATPARTTTTVWSCFECIVVYAWDAYGGDKDDIYASLGLARQWEKRHFPGGERALAIDCYLPCNWKLQVREIRCLAKAAAQMQHAHVQGRGNVKFGRTLSTIREVIRTILSPAR